MPRPIQVPAHERRHGYYVSNVGPAKMLGRLSPTEFDTLDAIYTLQRVEHRTDALAVSRARNRSWDNCRRQLLDAVAAGLVSEVKLKERCGFAAPQHEFRPTDWGRYLFGEALRQVDASAVAS